MEQLNDFKDIRDTMYYKEAALNQIERFKELGKRLDTIVGVIGEHHSKSIRLPAIVIIYKGVTFYLRDNFYDINLCVVSPSPITFPLSIMFNGVLQQHDWEWYLKEIEKARGYSWREFSDEQMDDPKVLHVTSEGKDGALLDWIKRRDEKTRWMNRFTSPEWHEKDWSSGTVCWEGKFGPGTNIFVQGRAFAQGIEGNVPEDALQIYAPGLSQFILELYNIEMAEKMIRRIVGEDRYEVNSSSKNEE